jgi:hypothetical protein
MGKRSASSGDLAFAELFNLLLGVLAAGAGGLVTELAMG